MRIATLLLLLCGLAWPGAATAQDYPSRPVKILVPYGPGGATDIVARVIAEQLRQSLGQSFIVENKPGAFGIIAIQELAKAAPDGYTLMIGNVSTNAITPLLYPTKLPVDYLATVVPVTPLADLPAFLLTTTANFPPTTVAAFVEYGRQHPGKLSYGTVGVGSYPHFDMVQFAKKAGLDMVGVPMKNGAGEVINAMVLGDVHAAFLNVASTAQMIKAGKLRPLAVTPAVRLTDWPDVPTMAEAGYPGIGTQAWQALFARAGTPKPVLDKLHRAAVQALIAPAVEKVFEPQGFNPVPVASPEAAGTWLRAEMEKWRAIVAEANIQLE
jgi:tripartite-type tricarboxylate transporter receptor subunit TctC